MSLPCVEVADAPSTAAFLANPGDKSLVQPALDILKNSKGIIKIYYGLQTEDRKHVYVYNVWEALQDHKNLQADPVTYPELGKAVSQFMTRASDITHIQVLADPYEALGAPVTELAYFIVKPGQSKEKAEEALNTLVKTINALPEKWGAISAVWGPTVEDANKLGLIIGWTSVEAHWNTVKTDPALIQLLAEARQVVDTELVHQELKEW